ncbi:MAG: DMT family transporter [Hyphomicrobiaceae bacterium]
MSDAAVLATGRAQYAGGIAMVLLATLGWSLAGLFVRLMPDLDGWQINCWRGLWTAVWIFLYLLATRRQTFLTSFRGLPLTGVLLSAGFFAAGSTLYVTSLTLTSTAIASCIGALSPIFTAVIAWLVLKERPGWLTIFAAMVAIAGVVIIFADGLETGRWLGAFTMVIVALSFSIQTVTLRNYRAFDMVPAIAAGGLLAFAIAALVGGGLDVGGREIALLAAMGLVQLALPLILFVRSAKHVPAVTLNLIALLDAVLNPLLSWIGAGEVPDRAAFIGGGVIVLAVLLSILGGRRISTADGVPAQAGNSAVMTRK